MSEKKINEIIEGLFLSNRTTAKNSEYLRYIKITHVLTVAEEFNHSELYEHMGIIYKRLPIKDEDSFPFYKYFDEASDFIHECLNNQGKIVVHCAIGISRSPTAVMAYLIKHKNFSMDEAFVLVKRKRNIIDPNNGFLQQLKEYESKIRKKGEEIKEEIENPIIYRCKNCRNELFKDFNIVHGMKEKKCTSIFLDKPHWIDDVYAQHENKLYCFSKKCQAKIGEYNISGNKCSCGVWISPSFQIHKSKID